jgi:hypothetical protein
MILKENKKPALDSEDGVEIAPLLLLDPLNIINGKFEDFESLGSIQTVRHIQLSLSLRRIVR